MIMGIEKRYLTQFQNLSNRLSPENLYCDGEISNAEAQRKYKSLRKDWKRLEKKVGRTVTETEVYELTYATPNLANLLASQVMRED